MNQHEITDAVVAGLPVHEGRAELLEEIMATSTLESTPPSYDERPPRHRRWTVALGAAAAVAAVLAGTAWLGQQGDGPGREQVPVTGTPDDVGAGDRAVLTAPGWRVRHFDEDRSGGEISYLDGERQLDIHWRAAAEYDSFVADRNDVGPPDDVDLLGKASLLWAYSDTDHTVIRPVEQDFMLEVRGSGMSRAAFLDLLGELRLVDEAGVAEHVAGAEKVSRAEELYQAPPVPVLVTADGWVPQVDGGGTVSWTGPDGTAISQVWVDGVTDPFTYDRYLAMDSREEIRVLGERALLTEWDEGATHYRAAATSPLTGDTILVLEAAGMTRAAFLEVVRSVEVVPAGEYERVVKDAID
jgi:hypothetical protein